MGGYFSSPVTPSHVEAPVEAPAPVETPAPVEAPEPAVIETADLAEPATEAPAVETASIKQDEPECTTEEVREPVETAEPKRNKKKKRRHH